MSTLHASPVWTDTPGETLQYGAGDSRTLSFSFLGYWKLAEVGITAPATSSAAVTAAESAGANLRIDGRYAGPTGTTTPSGYWVLAGLSVERVGDTNKESDVVWMFRVTVELGDVPNTTERYVESTTTATATSVSAFRIDPTIPTDNFTSTGGDDGVATNDVVWHGTTDIGGKKVDWSGQPIQYALPTRTTQITVRRPAPYWNTDGTRDTGMIADVSLDSALIGYRNSVSMGWMGDIGHVMLTGVAASPAGIGLYAITYTFRWHPWKHALQVPYVIAGHFDPEVNANNATRTQNKRVWWSQPHLKGEDFLTAMLTTEEWDAVGL
jgi:hypothetical protein